MFFLFCFPKELKNQLIIVVISKLDGIKASVPTHFMKKSKHAGDVTEHFHCSKGST